MASVTKRIDEEFAGKHGTVLFDGSLEDERDSANHAQTLDEIVHKIALEAGAYGGGIAQTAKATLHHVDRDVGGEYERREDADAAPSP